jgi:hypothetical protein
MTIGENQQIVALDDLRELTTETKLVEIDGVAGAFRLRRISVGEFIEMQEESKGADGEPDERASTVALLSSGIAEPELDEDTIMSLPLFVTRQLAQAIAEYAGTDEGFGEDSQTE